ncbi:MAG: AAA family ATPase [Gammaproteobacteria bacterium]|nr:AAA family ATPase [Gammaproteobacteria bacterium]
MYESFYNFTELPFRLTPDPRFYFSSATHKRALTHLRFGFHQREGFIVITGKPGTGKTELMLHLLEGLPRDRITYGKIVTSNLDANEILQQVAAAFRIHADGLKKGILLKRLEDVFLHHVRENKRLILIVDEAHKLSLNSLNELQMLTNFQLSGRAALQCFLSGHDSLKVHLQNPELLHLKQRVITSTFLMPLEKQETAEYIEHRLRCVGWDGDPKFNQTAYAMIHETTEGIPRQINALCNRILLRAYAEQRHYIDDGMVSRAIDDVQSEPLASNLPYQQALAETTGDLPQEPFVQPAVVNHISGSKPTAAFEGVNEPPVYPNNDQDETLPLPSIVHHSQHHANSDLKGREVSWAFSDSDSLSVARDNRNTASAYSAAHNEKNNVGTAGITEDEIIDEARKMSDALSDFHNKTSASPSNLKIPTQNTGRQFNIVSEAKNRQQSSRGYVEKRSAYTDRQTKRARSWGAPLAYGSIAFLLIAGGVFMWAYKFSNDILSPMQTKGSAGETFVAAIKQLFPDQNGTSTGNAAGIADPVVENKQGDSKVSDSTSVNDGNTKANESPAQQAIQALRDSFQNSNEPALTDADSVAASGEVQKAQEEHWDSGALGGQFLTQQDQQSNPAGQEQLASGGIAIAEVDRELAASLPERHQQVPQAQANPQSSKTPTPKTSVQIKDSVKDTEKASSKNQLAIASVVSTPKANKSTVPIEPVSKSATPDRAKAKTKSPAAKPTPKSTTPLAGKNSQQTTASVKPADKKVAVKAEPTAKSKTQKSPAPEITADAAAKSPQPSANKTSASVAPTPPLKVGPALSSKNVVVLNSGEVSADTGSVPVGEASDDINQLQLNELLAKLTTAYEKGNLQQLLSVLSKDIRSNDGSSRRDLKDGYRKLFNITDMRKMTISSVNWSKKDRVIHGEGEFELYVREKGDDKVTSYGGIISLDVDHRAEGAVITRLNYDYKN